MGKYDEWVYRNPIGPGPAGDRFAYFARHHVGEKNYSMMYNLVTAPFVMVSDPHTHDFDQFLHFLNADPFHPHDFPAEAEFCLGDEVEPHLITGPTVIHVPAGMVHGPLTWKTVNAPVIFMNVAFTPEYEKPGEHK